MENKTRILTKALIRKGALIPNPDSVYIDDVVDPDRISGDDVTIHAGCKLFGAGTLILPGVEIGREGPATVDNCQVGPDVRLNGGYFKDSVFLEKVSMGIGSHVREGCILEEEGFGGPHGRLEADHSVSLCYLGQPDQFL